MKLYKTTYEGSYKGSCYELEIFKNRYEIIWLDAPPSDINEAEENILKKYELEYNVKLLKIKNYSIPILWQSYRRFNVEATNLQDAIKKALDIFLSIPDSEYLEDSFEIDPIVNEEYPNEEWDIMKYYEQ